MKVKIVLCGIKVKKILTYRRKLLDVKLPNSIDKNYCFLQLSFELNGLCTVYYNKV